MPRALILLVALAGAGPAPAGADVPAGPREVSRAFLTLPVGDASEIEAALATIDASWADALVPMAIETLRLVREPQVAVRLVELLRRRTGQPFGYELSDWQTWYWNRPPDEHPGYAAFKAALYSAIDPRFAAYFSDADGARIRLDEIVWGGVRQDGIPPLRSPKMITADEADYLDDDNVVFGIDVGGDVRAYPKRILGWHEMFVDEVGGVPVAGVYCTLCGTVILYRTEHDGIVHRIGTSGFLYRSNKLMYDQATQSLWSTFRGEPVVGPLVGRGIALERLSVVTTTWGEWRRRHPDTTVLSIETGYRRDYDEGAAYREYFADDELMFAVPGTDSRLPNKAEVLALLLASHPDRPVAISARFLAAHPVHHERVGDVDLVVLTDPSGANRAYAAGAVRFAAWDGDRTARDEAGTEWAVTEAALTAPDGRTLARVPAHRAFWFGWYAAFPGTRLVD